MLIVVEAKKKLLKNYSEYADTAFNSYIPVKVRKK
jgi:hypothetical protein